MHYIFNVKDAEEYGLEESIMLYNIKYWITLNKANNTNFHDGRTWTYNSISAYKKLFPFWSERQIWRILKSLIEKHILITGNYNKIAYDRTLWYAFIDESILLNGEMEITKKENRVIHNVTPIPDVNTDANTDKKHIKQNDSFRKFWDLYDKKINPKLCIIYWNKIDSQLYEKIYSHVKKYKESKPEKKYRKDPERYLKYEMWESEIIENTFKEKDPLESCYV